MTFYNTTSSTINTSTRLIDLIATGTVAVSSGSATVTGTTTAFLSEVQVGDQLLIAGTLRQVATVVSDTSLTLTVGYAGTTASGLSFTVRPKQLDDKTKGLIRITSHESNTGVVYVGESLNASADGTDITSTNRSEPINVGQNLYYSKHEKSNLYIRSGVASQKISITII